MKNMNISQNPSSRLSFRFLAIIVIACVAVNTPLLGWGNPPPGRWEKASMIRLGDKITIYLQGVEKQNLIFGSVDDEFLHCVNQHGGKFKFDKSEVEKIIVHKAGKYARNGMLVGALGSAATVGSWGAAVGDFTTFGKAAWIALCAGAGALGGGITGAALGAPGETVYISKERAMAEAK